MLRALFVNIHVHVRQQVHMARVYAPERDGFDDLQNHFRFFVRP